MHLRKKINKLFVFITAHLKLSLFFAMWRNKTGSPHDLGAFFFFSLKEPYCRSNLSGLTNRKIFLQKWSGTRTGLKMKTMSKETTQYHFKK